MLKRIIIISIILILVIAGWLLNLLWTAGQFKTIKSHFACECSPVMGLSGAEDITIHPGTGIAYISACDRRSISNGKIVPGAIFSYNLKTTRPKLINLTPEAGKDFQPHGISLYTGTDGKNTLFVINHGGGNHRIEIFNLKDGTLIHRKTISDPMLVSPNDLVAVGPDQFYVTNDHKYVSGVKKVLEEYLKLKVANVVYYNGTGFSEAASGVGYANGINSSHDGKTIYLAATVGRSLHIFDRNIKSGKLELKNSLKLKTGLDNIEMDKDGSLWIGAHPQLLTFVQHSKNPSKISPSQILHVIPLDSGKFDIKEVYLNNGEQISGSSVAAVYNNRMIIGSVFEDKILDCCLK